MSNEEAFLAAIKAAPADDAPRLVYADWLEEHGRAEQATFIRNEHRQRLERSTVSTVGTDVDWSWIAQAYPHYRVVLNRFSNEKFFGIVVFVRRLTGKSIHETMDFVRTWPCVISAPVPIEQLFRVYQELSCPDVEVEFQYVPTSL